MGSVVTTILHDVRYAARALRHSPGSLVTTVVTLAVGLALVTVAFTVFNAYFLTPYAVRDPAALHRVGWLSQTSAGITFRWRDYEAISKRQDLFDDVVAQDVELVTSGGRALVLAVVSDNYFDRLMPSLAIGRGLAAFDASDGAVVLSHEAWTRRFDRAADVVGRQIEVSGQRFTIVGVLAPAFVGLGDTPADVWLPFRTYAARFKPELLGPQQPRAVEVMGWLRDGVTTEQAEVSLAAMLGALSADPQQSLRTDVWPESTPLPLDLELMLIISPIFVVFGLVLVTACANVSNVMLARAIARQREIAVRLSLGATRGRIVRQLATEGLLIALLAALVGLVLASWALRAGTAALFTTMPPSFADVIRLAPMGVDIRVFAFAFAVAAAATLLFAVLPALQASRLSFTGGLRAYGVAPPGTSRLRQILVAGQITVSMLVLVAAITFARGGAALDAVDSGFDTDQVISVAARADGRVFLPKLSQVLSRESGITTFAITSRNPFKGSVYDRRVAAAPSAEATAIPTPFTLASPEYFSVLDMPIERGRAYTPAEAAAAAPVAVVSAATARAFWPGQNPIGQTLRIEPANGRPVSDLPGYAVVTVIGTTRDVVSGFLVDGTDPGHIYLPVSVTHAQARSVLLRGRSETDVTPAALQTLLTQVVPDMQAFETLSLDDLRGMQIYPLQLASALGTLLAVMAVLLSVAGLYGVLTYSVNQRTREIGIRMAVGATANAVVRLVLGQSLRLAGVGAAIGLALAFAAMQALNAAIELRNLSLVDVTAFSVAIAVVAAATATAAFTPARRATRVDPAITLRAEG